MYLNTFGTIATQQSNHKWEVRQHYGINTVTHRNLYNGDNNLISYVYMATISYRLGIGLNNTYAYIWSVKIGQLTINYITIHVVILARYMVTLYIIF